MQSVTTYLLVGWVKPMGDVGACSENNWITLRLGMILIDQQSQVVHLVEEGYPNIALHVMSSNLGRSVVTSQLVGARNVLSFFNA